MGAWTSYGLGSENENLPGFIVLPEVSYPQGGAANWSNGYLPAHFQGTPLRAKGSPILDLTPPAGFKEAYRQYAEGGWQGLQHPQDFGGQGLPKAEFEHAHIHDVHGPEWIAWTPLLALILLLGVYPNLLFKVSDGSIVNVAQQIAAATGN